MNTVRVLLHLDVTPWRELPDELLSLAFRQSSARMGRRERSHLLQQYGSYHLEDFEVLGDAVLEMVVTEMLFYRISGPGIMSKNREELVRNTTLYCFMERGGLCPYITGRGKMTVKDCADVFEAVIGVMYFWMSQQTGRDALVEVGRYLRQWWYTYEMLEQVLEGGKVDTLLSSGRTVREVGNSARVARSPRRK